MLAKTQQRQVVAFLSMGCNAMETTLQHFGRQEHWRVFWISMARPGIFGAKQIAEKGADLFDLIPTDGRDERCW